MVAPPLVSAIILTGALILFATGRMRHDLVAVAALLTCVAAGLVTPHQALARFSDPAVITVASVLIVGRALELTGVAGHFARLLLPAQAPFSVKLTALMAAAAVLSAFMNNIAALVITMPLAITVARQHKLSAGATLMPLSFATILGGMTTLIGTPANLILSTVREHELGAPLGFFTMTPVGSAVCIAGLIYLALVGWRLLPRRAGRGVGSAPAWRVFELQPVAEVAITRSDLTRALRQSGSRLLALVRGHVVVAWPKSDKLGKRTRLLLLSRSTAAQVAEQLPFAVVVDEPAPGSVVSRMVVANGSLLIGEGHESVHFRSGHTLTVIAAGPRAALLRKPLSRLRIQTGDQLFIRGPAEALATFAARMRLLEVDRSDQPPVDLRAAGLTMSIFASAILAVILGWVDPALGFLAAAALISALGLIPAAEAYASIDWSVIVLLGAMMPVGTSFETSGAAAVAATALGQALATLPLVASLAAMCSVSMLLSIFLNNVATSVIMAPLAIQVATVLGVPPDAMLLAVLVGVSSDFLTPIGHQNNLLVMGPGGYRFGDYMRAGAMLAVLVTLTAALVLAQLYG